MCRLAISKITIYEILLKILSRFVTPVKNDYICSWRLRVSELYWRHKFGIYRVIKNEKLDLSEGILRKSTLKSLTPFCRYETLDSLTFKQV